MCTSARQLHAMWRLARVPFFFVRAAILSSDASCTRSPAMSWERLPSLMSQLMS